MSGQPPDPDWASRLVQGLLVPPLPQNYRKSSAALNDLTAPQALRAEWRRLYRGQPPRLSRDLLVRSIAYRIQELADGGLSKATRRKLLALTKVLQSNGSIEPDDGPNPQSGSAAGAGMARPDTFGPGDGGRLRI